MLPLISDWMISMNLPVSAVTFTFSAVMDMYAFSGRRFTS